MRAWRAFLGEYDRVLIKWPIFQARMNISIADAFYRLIHPIWEMYEKEYQGYLREVFFTGRELDGVNSLRRLTS